VTGRTAVVGLAALVALVVLLTEDPPDYVERVTPGWQLLVGAVVAMLALWTRRGWRLWVLGATLLLLPSAALLLFHLLRLVQLIPYPADLTWAAGSLAAVATLLTLWTWRNPLREDDGDPLDPPRGLVLAGVAAALCYPLVKTGWAAGIDWLAPGGVVGVVDAAYLVPVLAQLAATGATVYALRWWNAPAPRWAAPAALAGGLALSGLGQAGLYSTWTRTDHEQGALLGVLVYGGWLVWGLATLVVAARVSERRAPRLR